jgi:sortase A
MRRSARILGTVLAVAGVLGLAWVITVWRWQDPFTALYTHYEQGKLSKLLESEFKAYRPPLRDLASRRSAEHSRASDEQEVAAAAARFRREAKVGQAIGRIIVPRLGLNMVVVNGTDEASLEKGPGRYLGSGMPGQGRLVYIAGHRTTYLAPFSHIEKLRKGDHVTLEMPYATFVYRITGHRIVVADDLSVLRSHGHESLELQACHPRFFATHRYIAYALPILVEPRGGRSYVPAGR